MEYVARHQYKNPMRESEWAPILIASLLSAIKVDDLDNNVPSAADLIEYF